VRPAVETERAGIPTVVVTSTGFTTLAQLSARAAGVDGIRTAEYPGPLGIHPSAVIQENVESVLVDRIVAGLTSAGAGDASPIEKWDPRRIVFGGTLEEINEYFVDREWSEGLPIVPPTVERVEAFLAHIDIPADRPIATLPSANLVATPWNIAANAIMAGCRPEHMPLIMAAVEALSDERCSLANVGSSSGLFPFLIVNGPAVHKLGLATGGGLISKSPNTAVGRAVGLIVRNIAGFRPGKTYMGTFGYPIAFTVAENEAESPWVPFHLEQGFERSDSTVTVGVTTNWGSSPEASATPDTTGADVALELMRREILKKARIYDFPTIGPKAEHVMITVLMSPPIARSLAEAGYTKESIAQHLYENTRMRLQDFAWFTKHTYPSAVPVHDKAESGILPKEFLGDPESLVRVLSGPDIVHIIVCGDPNRNRMMVLEGGHTRPTTKKFNA